MALGLKALWSASMEKEAGKGKEQSFSELSLKTLGPVQGGKLTVPGSSGFCGHKAHVS